MSVTTAAKIAGLLELEPIQVIADIELERGEDAALWKRIRDAAVVAAMAFGAASFGLPGPAHAGLTITPIVSLSEYTLRANRRRVRPWPAWLAVLFRG
jgi:hypothetical protein